MEFDEDFKRGFAVCGFIFCVIGYFVIKWCQAQLKELDDSLHRISQMNGLSSDAEEEKRYEFRNCRFINTSNRLQNAELNIVLLNAIGAAKAKLSELRRFKPHRKCKKNVRKRNKIVKKKIR